MELQGGPDSYLETNSPTPLTFVNKRKTNTKLKPLKDVVNLFMGKQRSRFWKEKESIHPQSKSQSKSDLHYKTDE